ncbi:MAG: cupin domain-containing protein [Rhodospirillaceae bacterium]|jgi:quercetin dioxygenase-like cupin family protein|nr:cupin domain-containing protein [Rhodospirillaceae bacterium]MBT5240300.1 cupin domain-containing protein [Rhodospirillaceae bacterium]MBT5566058.1 cupin domain-containing protein [Rhodospirillaceae bacterium]MBT6090028.1 cupin domain-containing protein [Rhodospirillaceae bacterium]
MRSFLALAFSVCLLPITAFAETPMGNDVYVMADSTVPAIAMAAWKDGSTVNSVAGADASDAPSNAVTYAAKQVVWPTGRVRVMTFDKKTGGVLHPITDETLLYVLSGTAEVGVGSETVKIVAGDVVSFPSGALRNSGKASGAKIVTWNVPSLTGEATPTHVKGADVKEGGGGAITLKRYSFPGNSVRAVKLAAGGSTNPNSAKTDSMIYVTGGPMTFYQNGIEFVVDEGDFIREVAGATHNWNVPNDSGFVTTSGLPLDMADINPDEATDIPPER